MSNQVESNLINLEDVYLDLKNTENLERIEKVKGKYEYYHYRCDNYDDVGFGCGYRTTQTMCSWIRNQIIKQNQEFSNNRKVPDIPTILEMQKILVDCGDKPSSFVGSSDWIGCFESSIIIDTLYDVPCKILHSPPGELGNNLNQIYEHFQKLGCPIMMGGDFDNASKGVLGIGQDKKDSYLLIADPHYRHQNAKKINLIQDEWISWRPIESFQIDSFYNFCLPQKA